MKKVMNHEEIVGRFSNDPGIIRKAVALLGATVRVSWP